MEFVDGKTIKMDKELNELDNFVIEFLKIIEKHAKYVVVSGYIPILFGRSRATEDVDVFIEELTEEKFLALFSELDESGWRCINTENSKEMFAYLNDNTAIRFAKKGEVIPNMEVKFARKSFDRHTMEDSVKVIIGKNIIFIPSIEEQIVFKKIILGSDKDKEDARHLEEIFKDMLDKSKLSKLEKAVRSGEHEF